MTYTEAYDIMSRHQGFWTHWCYWNDGTVYIQSINQRSPYLTKNKQDLIKYLKGVMTK